MPMLDQVTDTVNQALGLTGRPLLPDRSQGLLGCIPELDSIAVLSLISALEQRFDIRIEADDLTADAFDSLGALTEFIIKRLEGH